jgi:RHH-type rel operon transcriptional repressor/antitoxin RelB
MSAVSLRLPDELSARLDALAKKTGRTKSYYMIEAIQDRLSDLEDWYEAEWRMQERRAGRSKSSSLDEVEKRLGLED